MTTTALHMHLEGCQQAKGNTFPAPAAFYKMLENSEHKKNSKVRSITLWHTYSKYTLPIRLSIDFRIKFNDETLL